MEILYGIVEVNILFTSILTFMNEIDRYFGEAMPIAFELNLVPKPTLRLNKPHYTMSANVCAVNKIIGTQKLRFN